jgi:hypothetical protein
MDTIRDAVARHNNLQGVKRVQDLRRYLRQRMDLETQERHDRWRLGCRIVAASIALLVWCAGYPTTALFVGVLIYASGYSAVDPYRLAVRRWQAELDEELCR